MTPDSAETESNRSMREEQIRQALDKIISQQNISFGIAAGFVASIVAAVVWAAVTVGTQYEIGWMAVGVGFLVGYAVRVAGKGISPKFGYVGAVLALFGCVLGNFLSIVGFISMHNGTGYLEVLSKIDYSTVPQMMSASFQPMDVLFYGIALYEGYKFSFRRLNTATLGSLAPQKN